MKAEEWISVKDRLPDFGTYIVCLENQCVMEMNFSNIGHPAYWFKVGVGDESKLNKVTHWMPLPQPPKDHTER